MKERAIIYGAGGNARKLLSMIDVSFPYRIECLVDREKTLLGTRIEGIPVEPIDRLRDADYDKIIISLDHWEGLAEWLQSEFRIPKDKIDALFILNDYRLLSLDDMKLLEVQERQAVCEELLDELCASKELDGYENLVVIGTKDEYEAVKSYMERAEKKIKVIDEDGACLSNSKYLFTGKNYRNEIKTYRKEQIIDDQNWNFVPLFAIEED